MEAYGYPAVVKAGWDVPGFFTSVATGINDSGQIVGFREQVFGGGNARGYLFSGGIFSAIDFPAAGVQTVPEGINKLGDVIGNYRPSSAEEGFLLSGGTYTTIDVPNSQPGNTNIDGPGINSAGQIVGTYVDLTGITHGFLATPPYNICLLYDFHKGSQEREHDSDKVATLRQQRQEFVFGSDHGPCR